MNHLLIVMRIKIEAAVIVASALENVVIIPWLTNYPVFALKIMQSLGLDWPEETLIPSRIMVCRLETRS